MKQSARSKRLAKHHKRFNSGAKLNLVSLMDIFTILVFFLIVNQSEVQILQNIKEVNLPVSLADTLPSENVVITVLADRVLVQDRSIWYQNQQLVSLNTEQTSALIKAIKTELNYLTSKRAEQTATEQQYGRAATIIGDSNVPYQVLKQIMAACAESDYRNLSLAVEQVQSATAGVSP